VNVNNKIFALAEEAFSVKKDGKTATITNSKVFPGPDTARSVWRLQTATNMVAEHSSATVAEGKDNNILCCSDTFDVHMAHNCKSVFDLVRTG